MIVLVALTDGTMVLIDQKWFLEVTNAGPWYNDEDKYAYKRFKVDGKWKKKYLHQFIGELAGIIGPLDHKNLDGLDNREDNLRPANQSKNLMNKGIQSNNKTGVKGIYQRENGKYEVQIMVNYKVVYREQFTTLEEAIEARRKATIKYHGEFGRTE